MKFTLTFALAWAINIVLFLAMIQMIATDRKPEWVKTVSGDIFDFVRQPAKTEALPRNAAQTPPKPEPEPTPPELSDTRPDRTPPTADMRALPLPVAALKIDIPDGIDSGSGPSLPRVVVSGNNRTGALGSGAAGGMGSQYGFSQSNFIMADQLTAISKVEPLYPQQMRFRRIEGDVWVEFIVTADGTVDDPKVVKSAEKDTFDFDRAVLQAIRHWRFQPPRNPKGRPTSVRVRQHFVFKLNR